LTSPRSKKLSAASCPGQKTALWNLSSRFLLLGVYLQPLHSAHLSPQHFLQASASVPQHLAQPGPFLGAVAASEAWTAPNPAAMLNTMANRRFFIFETFCLNVDPGDPGANPMDLSRSHELNAGSK